MPIPIPDKRLILALFLATLLLCSLLLSTSPPSLLLCSSPANPQHRQPQSYATTLLHYATTSVIPQQSREEIAASLQVLLSRRPCNFLVFGLGHDSLMWAAFNPSGSTLFLEEDPKWVDRVLKNARGLLVRTVKYPTHLRQADELMRTYRDEPYCLPPKAFVKGNVRCRLALADLPEEVYAREWDVIMIDAPRGFFPEAPGRMGAIWSAAVMARNRKGKGHTDVFLHDVNRKVEKAFALEFLCKKYLVKGVQRLWHFKIPRINDGDNLTTGAADTQSFC